MDIEEEFLEFLENVPRKVGQPKMDGTPRKMAELDPALQCRNHAVILSYYGFGEEDLFMPTYEELGERHGGLTRERIRQLIQRNYLDQLDGSLSVATEVANVISQQDFWEEQELLERLQDRSLIGALSHVASVIQYLKSQKLVENYDIFLPTLKKATRGSYFEHETRVIIRNTKIKNLINGLNAAQKIPGQVGIGNIRYARFSNDYDDNEILKKLILFNVNAWTAAENGQFWYIFEDRLDNSLINAAEKVFSIVERLPMDSISEMLSHALRRRTAPTVFPEEYLIRAWITQSRYFSVEDGLVRFKGNPTPLLDAEQTLVDVMQGKGGMPTAEVTKALRAKGMGADTANKLVFNSPLIFVDRSGGRGSYLVTLATDLGANINADGVTRYDSFKKRLARLGKTDRASKGIARQEQSILADWIFGDKKHGECAICQQEYSRKALIVAHKKKRSQCTDNERRDPHIVFPLCVFGCDFLYEHGFLRVQNGRINRGNATLSETEKSFVEALIGKRLKSLWMEGPPEYFDNH